MPSKLTNLPSLKSRSGVKPRPCFSHLRITPKFKKRYSTRNLGVTLHHTTITQRKRANPCEIAPFMCGNFNEDYLRARFLPLRTGFTACVGATGASTITQRKRANPCEIAPFMCGNFNEDYLRARFLPLRTGFTACVGATGASVAGVSDTVSDSASAFGCSQHPQQHSVLASSVAQVHSP